MLDVNALVVAADGGRLGPAQRFLGLLSKAV